MNKKPKSLVGTEGAIPIYNENLEEIKRLTGIIRHNDRVIRNNKETVKTQIEETRKLRTQLNRIKKVNRNLLKNYPIIRNSIVANEI